MVDRQTEENSRTDGRKVEGKTGVGWRTDDLGLGLGVGLGFLYSDRGLKDNPECKWLEEIFVIWPVTWSRTRTEMSHSKQPPKTANRTVILNQCKPCKNNTRDCRNSQAGPPSTAMVWQCCRKPLRKATNSSKLLKNRRPCRNLVERMKSRVVVAAKGHVKEARTETTPEGPSEEKHSHQHTSNLTKNRYLEQIHDS